LATTPTIVIGFNTARSQANARQGMASLRRSYETGAKKVANSVKKIWASAFDFKSHLATVRQAFTKLNSFFVSLFSQSFFYAIKETADQFLTFNNVVQSMTGSAAEAGEQFKFLADNSLRLGFDIDRTTTAYKKLFAAGKITGFQSKEIENVFSSLSETAVVTGMSSYQLEGALKAVTQMMSKGRVQAEELRGQLGEHLPGAFELAAGAMNMTTSELEKSLIKGLISAEELLTNLPKELRRVYGPALEKALRTPVREIERLKTTIRLYLKDTYKGVNELLFSITKIGTGIAEWIGTFFKAEWNNTLNYISAILQASQDIFGYFKEMLANLIGPIQETIFGKFADFLSFLLDLVKTIRDVVFLGIRKTLLGLGATIGGLIAQLTILISNFSEMAKLAFRGISLHISGSFKNAFATIKSGFGQLINDIVGVTDEGTIGRKVMENIFGSLTEIEREAENQKLFASWDLEGAKQDFEDLVDISKKLNEQVGYGALSDFVKEYMSGASTTTFGEEWNKFLDRAKISIDEMYKKITDLQSKETKAPIFKNKPPPMIPPPEEIKDELKKIEKEVIDMWTRIGDSLANSLTDAFGDFLETGKLDVGKWIREVAIDINKIIFQELIAKQIGTSVAASLRGMFGNNFSNTGGYLSSTPIGGGGTGGGGLDLSLGGGGGLDLTGAGMAKGGILNGPAVLAGEAGPEGILPLSRTSNGDLGVKASGGNVIINNYSGQEANTSKDINGNTTVNIGKMVQEAVNTNIASGRHDRILKHRFQLGMRGV